MARKKTQKKAESKSYDGTPKQKDNAESSMVPRLDLCVAAEESLKEDIHSYCPKLRYLRTDVDDGVIDGKHPFHCADYGMEVEETKVSDWGNGAERREEEQGWVGIMARQLLGSITGRTMNEAPVGVLVISNIQVFEAANPKSGTAILRLVMNCDFIPDRVAYDFSHGRRCIACDSLDTVAVSTQGAIQYRRCRRIGCKHRDKNYTVLGRAL